MFLEVIYRSSPLIGNLLLINTFESLECDVCIQPHDGSTPKKILGLFKVFSLQVLPNIDDFRRTLLFNINIVKERRTFYPTYLLILNLIQWYPNKTELYVVLQSFAGKKLLPCWAHWYAHSSSSGVQKLIWNILTVLIPLFRTYELHVRKKSDKKKALCQNPLTPHQSEGDWK